MGNCLVLDVQKEIIRISDILEKRAWISWPSFLFLLGSNDSTERKMRMKKVVLLLTIAVFALTACTNHEEFIIKGTLPDKSLEGEWIYLVPIVNAPVERVDSTTIKDGEFCFKESVDSIEIYVIRARPHLRLSLQELLVVKESGSIRAYLGKNSSAHGTALNDSLQQWKEQKQLFDNQQMMLQKNLQEAKLSTKEQIKSMIDELQAKRIQYNFQFASSNKNNVVGQMVIRFMKGSFSPEQRKQLGIE